jgi:hypothetical protein
MAYWILIANSKLNIDDEATPSQVIPCFASKDSSCATQTEAVVGAATDFECQ